MHRHADVPVKTHRLGVLQAVPLVVMQRLSLQIPSVSNCQEAQALGFCENVPSEAKLYCSGTCGLCNGTANVSTVCQDGVVPPEILNGIDCSMVQAGK